MRVLVGCEFSGIVRDAFLARGHDAWSCDLLPCERPGPHLQQDVLSVLDRGWDLAIFHPPCQHLCSSGARWWKDKQDGRQLDAIAFFLALANCPHIPRIAVENPVGLISTWWRKPDQIVQPWWFSDPECKSTCLWLKNLPLLRPTHIVAGRGQRIHRMPDSKNRSRERSRTFEGFAKAMAEQWGTQ